MRLSTSSVLPIGALAVIAVFFLATIRPGQDWTMGDDFAQYILHARNLAQGRAYADTGYLYNPDVAVLGPPAYPPVLPMALVPIWAVFGLNLMPMKALMVAFLVGALGLVSLLTRKSLSSAERATLILLVGTNPYFWDFKDYVLSDVPFLFFACLVLLAFANDWPSAVLGIALYLAYGTRAVGLTLAIAVVAFDLWRCHRVRRSTLVAVSIFAVLAVVQQVTIPGVDVYLQQLRFEPAGAVPLVLRNLSALASGFTRMWSAGSLAALGTASVVGGAVLVAIGYVRRVRDGVSVLEVFVPVYIAAVVAWPRGQEVRFLIPSVPFVVLYAWLGMRQLPLPRRWPSLPGLLVGGLVAVVLLGYLGQYTRLNFGPIPIGVGAPDTQALFAFVREQTQPADVVVFRRPRALALFTGRPSGAYAPGAGSRDVGSHLHDVAAAYAVSAPQDRAFWAALAAANPALMQPVYSNATYVVYRISRPGSHLQVQWTVP